MLIGLTLACVDLASLDSIIIGLSYAWTRLVMTPLETLVLATYFFILIILAVYGWHRYYLV